jgi:hypothetical protein
MYHMQVETGGDLNEVIHFSAFDSAEHFARVRTNLSSCQDWQNYLDASLPFVQRQESTIFMDCGAIRHVANLPSITTFQRAHVVPAPCYELRTYQLELGYNPVPKLVEEFTKGIPAKLAAADYGQLVLIAASEVGDLNKVIELWRFDDAASCLRHREASRKVAAWKTAIGAIAPSVQSFKTTFLTPLTCSPFQ